METTRPIACTLTETDMGERRRRWHDLAGRAFVCRVQTKRGLQVVFRADSGIEDDLRELALLERDCCAFANWDVSTAGGHAVLDVTGAGDEGVAAVQRMFRLLET
jgi:hypothetical protein